MSLRLLACATVLALAGCTADTPAVGEVYQFVGPSGGQVLRGEVTAIGDCQAIAEAEQNDGDLTGVMAQFGERPDGPCAALVMEGMRPFAGPNGRPVGQMVWVLPLADIQDGAWERTEAGAPPLETRQPTSYTSLWLLAVVLLVILWPILKAMRRRVSRQRPTAHFGSDAPHDPRHAEFAAERQRWEQWQAERNRKHTGPDVRPGADGAQRAGSGWNTLTPEEAAAFYLLDLEPGATADQIRQARRKLAARWHPDRFEHDDAQKAKATEKLKRINQAYELLMKNREGS